MDAPNYVSAVFMLTTVLAVALFYRAFAQISASVANKMLIGLGVWIVLQGILAVTGFYLKTDTMPPRFGLAILPPFLTIVYLLVSKTGQNFVDKLPLKELTSLNVCRIPVEIVLLWLFQSQQVPQSMTFEGRNFDILSGLTALPMAWYAFQNGEIKRTPLLIWNIVCLALVVNVVTIGILSAPTVFQKLSFDQPNIGILKFPFGWLASVIVPIVIFSHLVSIRQLLKKMKTKKMISLTVVLSFTILRITAQQVATTNDSLELKRANNHPMQYFLSLPDNWTKEKKYPIVVIIEAADKEYKENALRFVRARKGMPFILVAPFNVNNSRYGRRDPQVFPYSPETWDIIEKTGDCTFNMAGITQIVTDVQQQYNGEQKYFITGFEAGAHTVWQFLFQHPERLQAAAPVAGNYNQNSCMTEAAFSKDTALINLPLKGFSGSLDTLFGTKGNIYVQWKNAKQAAIAHGYKNISETIVPNQGHVPLPTEVLNWFMEIWKE